MSNPQPIQPGCFYHIYNRGNNGENIFLEERNYFYFMQLYARYIEPVAYTYTYCLLRNHFHLLVRIRLPGEHNEQEFASKPPSQAFSNFFNAYARAFNQAYGRRGALFQRPFGRIQVQSQAHLLYLVHYIHYNPQKHGFVDDYRAWPYSSYPALASEGKTRLERSAVLDWFDGRQGFLANHNQPAPERDIRYLIAEDLSGFLQT